MDIHQFTVDICSLLGVVYGHLHCQIYQHVKVFCLFVVKNMYQDYIHLETKATSNARDNWGKRMSRRSIADETETMVKQWWLL